MNKQDGLTKGLAIVGTGLLALPLLAPLDLLPPLSWPQAARPKAMATATASVESFMCPPWLG